MVDLQRVKILAKEKLMEIETKSNIKLSFLKDKEVIEFEFG